MDVFIQYRRMATRPREGRVQTAITGPWAGQRAKQLSEIELDSSKAKPQILVKLASHKEACVSGSKVRSKRQRRAQPL